jgi:hypothetical protein
MFFKEARIKAKYHKANQIMEERKVFKKVDDYCTMMRLGKENEANRIKRKAIEDMDKIMKEVGITPDELNIIQKNISKWDNKGGKKWQPKLK